MSEGDWIGGAIAAARPQAIAALLRNFRDLDAAEEAFQEACLRALKSWPKNGPPRDAAAWLIMVGKNAGIDTIRKQSRLQPLPADEAISDLSDTEGEAIVRIDEADYRDDILRLLFVCCHP
ncbi:MAG: sigma factor, partial [Methylocystis sp.]